MQRTSIGEIELAFVDRGSGLPVVLIHGFPLDHTMWNAQIDALSASYRPIAPDLRGFGQSDVTGDTVTMEQLADDLAALLAAIGIDEPVVICGLSMGGYVAFAFQRRYSGRLRGLILCDTRAANDTTEMAAARREMAARVLHEGPAPLVEGMMPKLLAESSAENHPELSESLRRVMLGSDRQGVAAAALGMARRADVTETLGEIDCPTLVIVGAHDAISPREEMAAISRAIPHSRFVEISGSGHMSPMEAPAEVNAAILEFLATL